MSMKLKSPVRYLQRLEKLNLNVDEKYAIETYIDDSDEINQYLRDPNIKGLSKLSTDRSLALSKIIDSLITQVAAPTTAELIVWRGIHRGDVQFDKVGPGEELEILSRGIISTSLSKNVALRFAGKKCCLLKITIPPQFSALYVGFVSKFDEKEVLLPHNSTFVVTEVVKMPCGMWEIRATCTQQKSISGKIISN